MYEALMGENTEIREGRPRSSFFAGRRDKRQGLQRIEPMIVAWIEGLRAETAWPREDLMPTTNTCSYLQELIDKDEYDVTLKEKN